MAGESNRDLWQFITGTSFLHPKELVGEEIKRNKEKILSGPRYYQPQKTPSGEKLKKEKKVEGRQLECVQLISRFLGLDEILTYDLYCSYLLHEYRGSKQELQTVLNTERHLQQLMLKVRDYYHAERVYLLHCLKHILSLWQDHKHPYYEEYSKVVEELYKSERFITRITDLYRETCDEVAPTWQTHGNLMTERQGSVWLLQNLKEQCELLEIIFLYYKNVEHSASSLCKLVTFFKKQGFGRRQKNKHLLDEVMDPVMSRIGFLQTMLIIEGIDLEDLQERAETSGLDEHHIIKSPQFKDIEALFSSLGDIPPHGPLLLLWAAVNQLAPSSSPRSQAMVRKCGNRALELKVFPYVNACLKMEPFSGTTMLASVCHTVVYGLLSAVLHCFDENTLGDSQGLYELASTVLKRSFLADDFWQRDVKEGLGPLLQSASLYFPLDARPLLTLTSALASASHHNALQTVAYLQRLPMFTQYLKKHTEVESLPEEYYWRLTKEARPYPGSCNLTLPKGIHGRILLDDGKNIVQWEVRYDAFDVFVGEMESLLSQVAYGAGMVEKLSVDRVVDCCSLLSSLMAVDPVLVQEAVPQLTVILTLCNQLIHRFSQLGSPPLNLIAGCLDILTEAVKLKPAEIWHGVQQTGLLPFLTENVDNVAEIASGAGLHTGFYGRILAGLECTQGHYPVTMSVLNLLSNLIAPLHARQKSGSLMACVLFVSREIFPVFHKWRYASAAEVKDKLGQKCLRLFHSILNLLGQDYTPTEMGINLRDVAVYGLLYTESGKTLLDIIGTGVDTVETALAAQGSASEGAGVELIQLIRLAFSVLNRLLLLRPENAPPSPVEQCLSARPANRASRHVIATIAQYIYHRHDSRLPTLATLLLKRVAMVYPMSILACLGNDAEPIRDIYMARLQAVTEDVHLKVGILELLTVCVETQPGLIEIFLNLSAITDKKTEGKKDWSMGKRSCLHTVLALIEEKKQGGYQCPADLLCAVVEFIHALWCGHRQTAMAVLREKSEFWPSLCLSLTRNLQTPADMDVVQQVLDKEIMTVALILRILAQELYWLHNQRPDQQLRDVLKDILAKDRPKYWSKYCVLCMKEAASLEVRQGDIQSENAALQLILGLRNFLLVLAGGKSQRQSILSSSQPEILDNLLESIEAQFTQNRELTELNVKLASIAGPVYLSLLKHWISSIKDWSGVVNKLGEIVELVCHNSERLVASVVIGLVGGITHILQYLRTHCNDDLKGLKLTSLVSLVCSVLQTNTASLVPDTSADNQPRPEDVKLKLQVICVCLLQELIISLGDVSQWLAVVREHAVIQCLLPSLQTWIQRQQGLKYVHSVMQLFLTMCNFTQSAEVLSLCGVTHTLCLSLMVLYSDRDIREVSASRKSVGDAESEGWLTVYHLGTSLMSSLLSSLSYNFLQDALNFVGVHQDRMVKCLECTGSSLSTQLLQESVETCRFVYQLSYYRKEWFLHLPTVLHRIMSNVCLLLHRCVSLLIRPRLLQHILEKKGSKENKEQQLSPKESLLMTPVSRRLSHQSVSSDDTDALSKEVLQIQQGLLEVVSWSLAALKRFSPDLCQIVLDQSLDISEYQPLLELGFSTPAVELDTQPSFGTLLSCTNMCVRMMAKADGRGTSPSRVSSTPEVCCPVNRSMVSFVLENSLLVIMSQALRYLKDPNLSLRDKQLLKRELGTELNSILAGLNRHLRKPPASQCSSTTSLLSPQSSKTQLSTQHTGFVRLLQGFVTQMLR